MNKNPTIRYASDDELPNDLWQSEGSFAYNWHMGRKRNRSIEDIPDFVEIPIYLNIDLKDLKFHCADSSIYLSDEDKIHENLVKLVIGVPIPKLEKDECLIKLVDALKKQKEKILSDAHMAALKVQDQINDLLAIEYKPEK